MFGEIKHNGQLTNVCSMHNAECPQGRATIDGRRTNAAYRMHKDGRRWTDDRCERILCDDRTVAAALRMTSQGAKATVCEVGEGSRNFIRTNVSLSLPDVGVNVKGKVRSRVLNIENSLLGGSC